MKRAVSVKIKLAAGFVGLFFVLSVLFVFYLTAISGVVFKNSQKEDIRELVFNDMAYIEAPVDGRLSLRDGFLFEYSGVNVTIYSNEGALLAGNLPAGFAGGAGSGEAFGDGENSGVDPGFREGEVYEVNISGKEYLVLDIYYPYNWEDGIWIRGISELSDHSRILKNLLIAAVLTLPLFLSLGWAMSFYVSKKALLPLDLINKKASNINRGEDLKSRINLTKASSEFMELSDSMDRMLSRLEDSFESERRFSSDVSHELRTPVSIINGAAQYSLKYDETPEEWKSSMEMIRKNSEDMSGMIESLLSLSRMESGKVSLNMESVNLDSFLKGIISERFDETELEVLGNPIIKADESLLRMVVVNLLSNAYKYGGEDVHVIISVREVYRRDNLRTREKYRDNNLQGREINDDLGLSKNGAPVDVQLMVKDDGPGIPEEKLPYIFDRFYRVDDSRSGRIPGTGLGLSLVKEAVRIHGGEINVWSKLGEGTEFTIIFKNLF